MATPTPGCIMSDSMNEMRVLVQPTDVLAIQRAKREIMYGRDAAYTAPSYVLATIRVAIEVSSGDRGRVVDVRPIFEYPLLKEMYARHGGTARVISTWRNWAEPDDKNQVHRRIWKMTREDVMSQISSLTKRFMVQTNTSNIDLFEKVYGRGSSLTFHKLIRESYEAWVKAVIRIRKAGRIPTENLVDLNDEEYADIAAIFNPKIEGISGLDELVLPEIDMSANAEITQDLVEPPKEDLFAPSAIMTAMGNAGVDQKFAIVIEQLVESGRMSEDELKRHAMLTGFKQADFAKAIEVWKSLPKG